MNSKARANDCSYFVRDNSWDKEVVESSKTEYEIGNYKRVVDIGGHIGTFSIPCAKRGAEVWVYEPSSSNYTQLVKNAKFNNVNLNIINKAVGKNNILYLDETNFGMHTTHKSLKTSDNTEVVETILVNEIDFNCDYLKIDCEGAEYDFIFDIPFEKVGKIGIELHKGDMASAINCLLKYFTLTIYSKFGSTLVIHGIN